MAGAAAIRSVLFAKSGSFSGAIELSGYLVPACGAVPELGSVLTYGVNLV